MKRALAFSAFIAAAALACPLPANTPNVISSGAACAIDIVEDVSTAPTPALLTQTCADCGITAADLYADIQQLIANAKTSDASGTVTTRRGKTIERDEYVNHLEQWLQVLQDGGAQ